MELQEFYEYMEQHRANAVDAAVQRYRSLTPVLGKVRSMRRTAALLQTSLYSVHPRIALVW